VRTTEVVIRSVRERSEPETQRRDRAATPKETPGEAGKDSLPSIHEIRQQLPRQMERLLRVPTSEVAQHSYKSPFKETREELIQRLLDPCLTLEEAARLLGVCPTTVRRYTNRGLLRHQRTVGNQRRFRLSHVLEFLDEHGGTWRLDQAAEGDAEGSASGRSEDGSKTVH
jgi:excisionase family DNA binding protein